jgi:hypothetical protein
MIDSYWDLYVAYVHHCVECNKKHDIDPHHYEMEWNHFLPRCFFGDHPIGHYLLLKQHAIATALQTLAFKKNCLCGWHKKYLPEVLLKLSWGYYSDRNTKVGQTNAELKRGICNPEVHRLDHVVEAKRQNGREVAARFMEQEKGIFDPRFQEKILETRTESGKNAVINKTGIHNPENRELVLEASRYALENQKGIFDPENKEKVLEGSQKSGRAAVSNKTGIFSPEYEERHSEVGRESLKQRWKSRVDGYVSSAPLVAKHNKRNGWDPKARIRIS